MLRLMIGIDEVGRGCWAGPMLIVAARQCSALPKGLRDSKKLTKSQREAFIEKIRQSCDLGEGWVEPAEIDTYGLTKGMQLGVERALAALDANRDEEIIIDGSINYCAASFSQVVCVPKADDLYPIVSAASIYAKVRRDETMLELGQQYPQYEFGQHVGYGTKLHKERLAQYGVTPLHRKSYKPVQALL